MTIEANEYRRQWAAWLSAALPALEREDYQTALAEFPKPPAADVPFRTAPPARRIAVFTSAGAYDRERQAPFASTSAIGDITHRVFPHDTPAGRIAFRHGHYDATAAEADREVVLPLGALRDNGATLTANVVSTMGYCLDWPSFIEQTIPQIVEQVRIDGANCALLVPV